MSDVDPFLMSNLPPRRTGLPFVVWISVQQRGFDRVHVWAARRSLRPKELALVRRWMKKNVRILELHWDGEIDSKDAIDSVVTV